MLLLLMLLLFKVNIRLDPQRGGAGVTAILFAARQKLLGGKASSNCLRYPPLSTVSKDGIIWRRKKTIRGSPPSLAMSGDEESVVAPRVRVFPPRSRSWDPTMSLPRTRPQVLGKHLFYRKRGLHADIEEQNLRSRMVFTMVGPGDFRQVWHLDINRCGSGETLQQTWQKYALQAYQKN